MSRHSAYRPPSARQRILSRQVFDDPPEAPAEKVSPEPEPVSKIDWSPKMLKAQLLKIANDVGIEMTEENTKAQIVAALEQYGV